MACGSNWRTNSACYTSTLCWSCCIYYCNVNSEYCSKICVDNAYGPRCLCQYSNLELKNRTNLRRLVMLFVWRGSAIAFQDLPQNVLLLLLLSMPLATAQAFGQVTFILRVTRPDMVSSRTLSGRASLTHCSVMAFAVNCAT